MPLRYTLLIASLIIVSATGSAAQTNGTVTELDPGLGIMVELDPRTRLDVYVGKEKSEEIAASKLKVSAGASFRMKPIFKRFLDALDTDKQHLLVLGGTYEFSRASEAGVEKIEHKIMLDGTLRYAFPQKFLTSSRNRVELRWINGDHHWRYRNRLQVERPFITPIGKRKLEISPFGGVEAFWDQRYKKWSMFKFRGGVEFPLFRRTSVEFLYERQHCVTCADRNTNIFGLTLNMRFRMRKK